MFSKSCIYLFITIVLPRPITVVKSLSTIIDSFLTMIDYTVLIVGITIIFLFGIIIQLV